MVDRYVRPLRVYCFPQPRIRSFLQSDRTKSSFKDTYTYTGIRCCFLELDLCLILLLITPMYNALSGYQMQDVFKEAGQVANYNLCNTLVKQNLWFQEYRRIATPSKLFTQSFEHMQ